MLGFKDIMDYQKKNLIVAYYSTFFSRCCLASTLRHTELPSYPTDSHFNNTMNEMVTIGIKVMTIFFKMHEDLGVFSSVLHFEQLSSRFCMNISILTQVCNSDQIRASSKSSDIPAFGKQTVFATYQIVSSALPRECRTCNT